MLLVRMQRVQCFDLLQPRPDNARLLGFCAAFCGTALKWSLEWRM